MAQLMSIKKNVDVQPGAGVPAIFHCSQGDKGTRIILGLLNNNDSYTIPEGTTAIIRGSRADGTLFTEITADIDTTTEIKFNLTEDMTSVPGPVECEAVMTSGSANVIGTANFIIDVERSPASIGSVFPGTDAATTWLIDKLENESLNSLNGESVVDAINNSASSGLTEDVKVALLACFEKVAWIDEDGQDYYDALYNALYPPADLVSISAVYTQSGTVYNTDTLDSLKTDLIVTAHMSDSSTQTVTTYLLSGTLATGTSTITVSYGGKVTTFSVTVTHATVQYTITNSLTNCANSNSATVINEETSYSGTLSATSGYIMATVSIIMGNTNITATSYNSETGAISIASVTGNVVITAEAVEDVGWISGVPYNMTADGFVDGYYLNNGVETPSSSGYACSPYLPCTGAWIKSNTAFGTYTGEYTSEKVYIRKDAIKVDTYYNFDEYEAAFLRVSERSASVQSAIITPYRLPKITENTVWVDGQYYYMDLENVGSINDSGIVQPSQTGYRYSDYLNCYNATTITESDGGQWKGYVFYNANKEFMIRKTIASAQSSASVIDIPEGAKYFRFIKGVPNKGICLMLS